MRDGDGRQGGRCVTVRDSPGSVPARGGIKEDGCTLHPALLLFTASSTSRAVRDSHALATQHEFIPGERQLVIGLRCCYLPVVRFVVDRPLELNALPLRRSFILLPGNIAVLTFVYPRLRSTSEWGRSTPLAGC